MMLLILLWKLMIPTFAMMITPHYYERQSEVFRCDNCKPCVRCPRGQETNVSCGLVKNMKSLIIECQPCSSGYHKHADSFASCRPCSFCSDDEVEIKSCTAFQNRRCICKNGYYRHPFGHCEPGDKRYTGPPKTVKETSTTISTTISTHTLEKATLLSVVAIALAAIVILMTLFIIILLNRKKQNDLKSVVEGRKTSNQSPSLLKRKISECLDSMEFSTERIRSKINVVVEEESITLTTLEGMDEHERKLKIGMAVVSHVEHMLDERGLEGIDVTMTDFKNFEVVVDTSKKFTVSIEISAQESKISNTNSKLGIQELEDRFSKPAQGFVKKISKDIRINAIHFGIEIGEFQFSRWETVSPFKLLLTAIIGKKNEECWTLEEESAIVNTFNSILSNAINGELVRIKRVEHKKIVEGKYRYTIAMLTTNKHLFGAINQIVKEFNGKEMQLNEKAGF